MHKITVYPLGNADCYRIDLSGGGKLLFDYAATRTDEEGDKRIDLPRFLRDDLDMADRKDYDVVAFTHLDLDHICGASEFFEFRHAAKYQGGNRIQIKELWVPAFAILEDKADLCDDGKVIQAEARHRLLQGEGVRVFSRPQALEAWLKANGLSLADRAALISDAGTVVPGWGKTVQGVEFFVHSPFASRQDSGDLLDRNSNSLVFQATFVDGGIESYALLMADSEHEVLSEIVRITKVHQRESRLTWDLVKLPHHCSYLSLGPDKGAEKTKPVEQVAWLYEKQGRKGGRIVSTSWPIPSDDADDQPPHRQAANYYKDTLRGLAGEFLVTMEHPSEMRPAPLVIEVGARGMAAQKPGRAVGALATGSPAPRAG